MITNANALALPFADGIAQVCVTSPPYFGLRDYQTGKWEGGDETCDHKPSSTSGKRGIASSTMTGGQSSNGHAQEGYRETCPRCGARRIDQQIGLERTPAEYVANIVAAMREVRRVLRDDGMLWLNLGDSYAGGGNGGGGSFAKDGIRCAEPGTDKNKATRYGPRGAVDGLKPKDLIGIPWRVAFALQTDGAQSPETMAIVDRLIDAITDSYDSRDEWPDRIRQQVERLERERDDAQRGGWYLRSDVIWHKLNPMPESVTDRPTKSHEYVFLFAKNGAKPLLWRARDTGEWSYAPNLAEVIAKSAAHYASEDLDDDNDDGESNQPALFELPEPRRNGHKPRAATFDRSGNPVAGHVLPGQSAAQHRARPEVADDELIPRWRGFDYYYDAKAIAEPAQDWGTRDRTNGKYHNVGTGLQPHSGLEKSYDTRNARSVWTIATAPYSEAHFATFPPKLARRCILAGSRPGDIVLDPFSGSGTTGKVAIENGRQFIGTELSREYIALAQRRTTTTMGIQFLEATV